MPAYRCAAFTLALVAMLLRGLLPAGWMPNTGGAQHSGLMPCPGMGAMRGMAMPAVPPAKHGHAPTHDSTPCPFAAAAHFVPPAALPSLVPQTTEIGLAVAPFSERPAFAARDWDHAPRAPPPII
ncbi:MAG: hypothetical protein JO208_05125 [Alphaproteobacteria bacterium]|nr:hypothetical protein [Alphaproteobacteria bacterium]